MIFHPKYLIFPIDRKIFKNVLTLALPVILGNLSRVLMNITDVAMVGRLGKNALAAVGMGSFLIRTVMSRRFGMVLQPGLVYKQ
ncbi:MAG: hypothetical protein IIA61_09840 [Candidatus Marinimicrobia bacterium]|nr:hypothetical protein [Candidatus Neomarinimicrobiota bacterium]